MIEPGGAAAAHPPAPSTGGPLDAVLDCFDAVPAMLWAMDGPQLLVTAANAGARASVGRTDLLGVPIREVLTGPDALPVLATLEAAYAAGEPATGEQRLLLTDLTDQDQEERERLCVRTWTVLPTFHADGSVRGLAAHVVDTTERAHALTAAEQAALAAERRYREVRETAHDAALDLRRALLPSGVPLLSRLRMAVRFRVAEHPPAAGGDWFDALPLGDGRVALLIGEVKEHGVAAAGAMGQLRAVAVEAVAAGEKPADVLARLDRFAAMAGATRAATLCLAVLDPASGELTVGSHGHPAPLVVAADASTRFLAVEPAWPLGTGGPAPALLRDRVVPGELLLLYTDGLVERPGRRPQDTTAAFARVASAAMRDSWRDKCDECKESHVPCGRCKERGFPCISDAGAGAGGLALADRVASVVLDRLARLEGGRGTAAAAAGQSGYSDDAMLLVAHVRPPFPPLRLRFAAGPASGAPMRRQLAAWLDGAGFTAPDAAAVTRAAGEAIANVVEHAYGPGPDTPGLGWVELRAQLTRTAEVRVTVRDGGTWRDPATGAPGRGRGMLLMRELVDDVGVSTDTDGTTVTLTHRAERPAGE